MLSKLYEQRIYNSIAQARLEDVMALSERYGKLNKRKRETCFFVTLFARLAGYSKPAALELTELVNLRYRKPLHRWQLMSAIQSAEACFEENGVIYYYSNARLVRELDIRGEKYLQLKAIMSDKERKRRKAIKDRASYARRRGGISWKEELREVIDLAKEKRDNIIEFEDFLADYGVTLPRFSEKTISYVHPKRPKHVRGSTLGEGYTAEAITAALSRSAIPCEQKA